MKRQYETRRRFIRAGITVPLLAYIPWRSTAVIASPYISDDTERFEVPQKIYEQLFQIYGGRANAIASTRRLELKAPDIAENSAVVPVMLKGQKQLVTSFALFVEQNNEPLTAMATLYDHSDLTVALRVRIARTSHVYLVADTAQGLLGVKKYIKVTIGCGGG